MHIARVVWQIGFHEEFEAEFWALATDVQDELLARLAVLAEFGPALGRPHVDTLKGSSFANMKELRFRRDGVWRFAFAFDTKQTAIILVGGDKEGERQKSFYRALIRAADRRFAAHVTTVNAAKGN